MSSMFFLEVRLNKRWGFVIYRTDYSSEEGWIKFTKMLETWCSPTIENKGPEEAPLIESWKQNWYMSDKDRFKNASHSQLKQHFHFWLASLSTRERSVTMPEHYMFLVVDKDVLDIIHNTSPEPNYTQLDPVPYFMALDKDGPDEDSGYPGAMKVPLEDLMYLYEEGLERDSMRGLCLKGSEWFERDEIDFGGYVIYRTNYSSEEDWTKFLNMFATWTTPGFPSEDWVVGRTVRDWQKHWWQKDKTNFEHASIEALRTHVRSWLAAQDVKSRRITFSEAFTVS